jgi:hypothetical protein
VADGRLGRGARRLGRGARRLGRGARRLGPLGWAALLLVVAVVAAVLVRATRPTPAGPGGGSTVRVGVRDGDSIPGYVAASRAELEHLTGPDVYALVSLTTYLSPEGVAAVLGPAAQVRPAVAYARVPLPHRQTEIVRLGAQRVPQDIAAAMDSVAARSDAPEEAAAYRVHCACVYALVVRGSPDALRGLAGRASVRAVDPAPEVAELGSAVFVAPLPEQADRVAPPPDDGRT